MATTNYDTSINSPTWIPFLGRQYKPFFSSVIGPSLAMETLAATISVIYRKVSRGAVPFPKNQRFVPIETPTVVFGGISERIEAIRKEQWVSVMIVVRVIIMQTVVVAFACAMSIVVGCDLNIGPGTGVPGIGSDGDGE